VKPLVSVIVTTLNEEKYIKRCLKSIKNQSYKPIEIVVSDACSIDKTVEAAKKYADKVVVKKSNIPQGKNIGAKYTRGEILVFVDADSALQKSWIEKTVKNLEEGYVFISGTMKPIEKNPKAKFTAFIWGNLLPTIIIMLGCPGFAGAATFAVKKKDFKEINGFNEGMYILEDVDFVRRISKLGKIKFDKKLFTFTSMRRFEKEGYIKWFLTWFAYGLYYFIFGRSIKTYKDVR
jgi:glycosyltransferase involved in cell wall biosynthesis